MTVDLSSPRRLHLVGLGGAGMSAIAEVLVGTGHLVSGSDLARSAPLDRLAAAGVETYVGHRAEQVREVDYVAVSTAIPADNPEVIEAERRGIPVVRRAELLAAITRTWRTVAVAGTHGKTTTSAMLTVALQGAGLDPAYIIGGDLRDLGKGAATGTADLLIVEADESDGTFVELDAWGVIVTNVEPDHLEHYGGFEALRDAFEQFVDRPTGPVVLCLDDPGSAALVALIGNATTYGVSDGATWRLTDPLPTPVGISFTVVGTGEHEGQVHELRLQQPGMHNARNAVAAFAMAVELGADPSRVAEALSGFGGVGRRFERRGRAGGVELIDDYAHLPTEVSAALSAAKSLEPARVVAVFQPHRYSRTEQLWSTFTDAFVDADVLIVTGIYAAGEEPRPGVSGRLIADAVAEAHAESDVRYVDSLDDLDDRLVSLLEPGDLLVTLGAGDLTALPGRLIERLGPA